MLVFIISSLQISTRYFTTLPPILQIASLQDEQFSQKVQGPAIATLVTNETDNISALCLALHSLKNLPDNSSAPALIFNENNLLSFQIEHLRNCTLRVLSFPTVNFSVFPKGVGN